MSLKFSLLAAVALLSGAVHAQEPRNRVSVRVGVGSSFFDQLGQPVVFNSGQDLRMSYDASLEIRTPFELGYQFRVGHNQWIGLSYHQSPNYLAYRPEIFMSGWWVGPRVLASDAPDRAIAVSYEANWTIFHTLRGYSRAGLGVNRQTTSDLSRDYRWYANMPEEFYSYAVAVSGPGLKPYVPMALVASGLRWKGFSLGYAAQGSLTPILKESSYAGSQFQIPIRHYFLGGQMGYSVDF